MNAYAHARRLGSLALAATAALVLTACGDRHDPAPPAPAHAAATAAATAAPAPPADPDSLAAAWARDHAPLQSALRPDAVADWQAAVVGGPLIEIDAKLDPATGTVVGTQRTWLGTGGREPAGTIALRCPANGAAFHGAGMVIGRAAWNGTTLPPPTLSADGTGLAWTLPWTLTPGMTGCLTTPFTALCSTTGGFHGLLARQGGHWCLYHWHPELAAWRDGGWFLPPVTGIGDESQTILAPVLARLTVPAGAQVIAAGIIARAPADPGWETVTIAAPTCRNLALEVVSGDDQRLAMGELVIDGVHVRSWAAPADADSGARALAVAVDSVRVYDQDFGRYPLNGLDVVETVQGDDVGGMESSGLVFIDSRMYAMCDGLGPKDGAEILPVLMLSEAVAHEVGHQWWYGLVGSDAFADPWLDESLTNASEDLVIEDLYGATGRRGARNLHLLECLARPELLNAAINRPLAAYTAMNDYGVVVYGRGALMYLALRQRLGDERYLAWLRAWQDAHRYRVATEADWRAHLAEALGADQAAAFANLWLSGDGMTRATVMATVYPHAGAPAATAPAPAAP